MPHTKLNAINDEGFEFKLLTPFFEALLPAFRDRADEIRIEPVGSGLTVGCGGKSWPVPLDSSLHNYGWIAFTRILILSVMSISLKGVEQTGGFFRVRYGEQFIPVQVTSRRDDRAWYLILRPAWEDAQVSSRRSS